MVIFDSVKREKVVFRPIHSNEVRVYVCGPTVYDDAHLGHARSAIVFDLLRRVLCALGYKVVFVRNITDIDDKIIKKSFETGEPVEVVTKRYTEHYLRDMRALNVLDADISPRATTSMDAIIRMISKLLENGCAYRTDDGTVWFDTAKDAEYCSLSHMCSEEEQMQSRIERDKGKKSPRDFALWKACKKNDICYDSPFGKGRPGWHIECSAMIESCVAYKNEEYAIDIHGGGADLFFPHHENEAAQTRCATHRKLAKYWIHNGFVNIGGEKMSKSLGNSFFVKDALKVYNGEILRFYLMSTHYRSNFNFNEEDLAVSKKRLDRIYRLKKRVYGIKSGSADKVFNEEILAALSDDLNISQALAVVDEMVSAANERLDENQKNKALKQTIVANIELLGELLGIGSMDAYEYFRLGMSEEEIKMIERLVEERIGAKKERNFTKADEIRERLAKMGVQLMDTPEGTLWEKSG